MSSPRWAVALGILTAWLCALPAYAEDPAPVKPEASSAADLTPEELQARVKQTEESASLSEDAKKAILAPYNAALEQMRLANQWSEKAQNYRQAATAAPEEREQVKAELAQPLSEISKERLKERPLADLEQQLSQAEQRLREAEKRFKEIDAEPKRRSERRKQIPKQRAALTEQIEKLEKSAASGESPELQAARQAFEQARLRALRTELEALEQESLSYDAQSELLPLRRDAAARRLAHAKKEVAALQETVLELRRQDARKKALEAKRAAANAHPAAERIAQENSLLAQQRTGPNGVLRKIEKAAEYESELRRLKGKVEEEFANITEKIEAGGLTNAVGLRLRRQRAELPDLGRHRRRIDERREESNAIQLLLIDLDDRRDELADVDHRVREMVAELQDDRSEPEFIEQVLREQLEKQREYLQALLHDYDEYVKKLIALDSLERELIAETEKFHGFIDENVLWIRSAGPLGVADLREGRRALAWLLDKDHWIATANTFWVNLRAHCLAAGLALIAITSLILTQRRLRDRLRAVGQWAARGVADRFVPTLHALLLTVVMAAAWPSVLWFAGWLLTVSLDAPEFAKAAGYALQTVALLYLTTELFRHACRRHGLAEAHFDWPLPQLKEIRHRVRWLLAFGLPAVFLVILTECQEVEDFKSSVGRFAFIDGLAVLAIFLIATFRPSGQTMRPLLAKQPEVKTRWYRHVWFPLAVLIPMALALLAGLGYYYTALQLAWRLKAALWVMLSVLLANALLVRWLLIARRRLALKRWREKRAQQTDEAVVAAGMPTPEDPQFLDLTTVHAQTRKLLRTLVTIALCLGLWFVWTDVLPALGVLYRIQVWPAFTWIEEIATATPEGAITLGHLLLGAVSAVIALAASKNLPGFLEIAVLQRLPMDNGSRYAVTTLCRYSIMLLGIVTASSQLGIRWDEVRWLLAAVSVGLGFGLQEIFANLVSGLILLFERPIRVGDIVTVADITGAVSRIRMRATTITNWDRKEFVVPNKEFITGRLLNWTLSDQVNRVVINVGVAYGSDTKQACELLYQVGLDHPIVLNDPPPKSTFEGFGASSLDLVLRCYLPNLENRLDVISDLHQAIDAAFKQAGIEIAFPQRDIHIRTVSQPLSLAAERSREAPFGAGEPTSADGQPETSAA